MPEKTLADELAALHRLVKLTENDSGQCARVANFLLALWNAGECGGFDLTDLWMLDRVIVDDILVVIGLIARRHEYPTAYDLGPEFEHMVKAWRPGHTAARPE
jgi:hypothetical protein